MKALSRIWILTLTATLVGIATTPAVSLAQRPAGGAPPVDTAWYSALRFRHIGPQGNRVSSVAGVIGNPHVYYAGAASGGLWKSSDDGMHWEPIFDEQLVSSVGTLAVSASDPNIVWAGTGEPFIRSHISIGWGVYKSTDAGKHWSKMGLENTGRISRIIVDPKNPDIVYVASLGHAYGPQQERGIYKTADGGKTWERVLFVDENTGASDLVMDPNNPRILFAGMWKIEIHTWGRESGGESSGIYTSRDGGATWKKLTKGLPKKPGKVGLGIARSNSNRVYALIETSDGVPVKGEDGERGELWRSDDGGENWQVVSYDHQLAGRTHYYNRMQVSPDNENEAYTLAAHYSKTIDGGKSTVDLTSRETPGGDHHDMWIDPTNGNRMIVAHDDGIAISTNRGRTWQHIELPIAQMYHVTTDNRVPYFVYGNRQDGPSARGPSNAKTGGPDIPRGMWQTVGGGESGWATPDPTDSNLVWSSASGFGSMGGIVVRHDLRTGTSQSVDIWPLSTVGWPAADLKYRFVWTFPLTISPHDHNRVYAGSQHVHVTTNGGRDWQVISPDLTRNDKSRQQVSGGLTPDNIGVEYAGVVFAIAESKMKAGLLWAGSNDGLVHVSQDGGKSWTNVTANIPGKPDWGTISNIEPSRYDEGTAYLTVDGHQVNNRDPWVYQTSDFGKSWKLLVNGIAKTPLSYAHVVREDPVRKGLLYLGTENGLYVSWNDGDNWQPLQTNLPHAPVYWLTIQEHFNDLVIATYGRGFWILDDITPLRTLGPDVLAKGLHLFTPRAAYRFRMIEAPWAAAEDPAIGQNPPYGASLNYWVKTTAKDSATIAIVDAGGKNVRTFKGPSGAGVNRIWWNLQFDQTKEPRQRTSPLYAPEIAIGPEGRPMPSPGRLGPLAPPGTYTVKVSIGGLEASQPLILRKDPNSGGSEDEVKAATALVVDVAHDLNTTVDMINALESARSQLLNLQQVVGVDDKQKDVKSAADALEKKLSALESKIVQTKLTGRGQDDVRWPQLLSEQLVFLASEVEGSDFAPTTAQRDVAQLLKGQLQSLRGEFDQAMSRDIGGFNTMLKDKGVQGILTRTP